MIVIDSVCIDVELALILTTIGHLIFKLVELLIAEILVLIMDRFGTLRNLLHIGLGLLSQVVSLLQLKKDLSLKIHG